jgi:16S rRNA (uracil1498-N3)-methyltransferase
MSKDLFPRSNATTQPNPPQKASLMNLILLQPSELSTRTGKDGSTSEGSPTTSTRIATLSVDDIRAKHIVKHLHKQSGDCVLVGVEGGKKQQAIVTFLPPPQDGSVQLALCKEDGDPHNNSNSHSLPRVTLILAMPFPMRLKHLWPVVASMGVDRIMVIRSCLSNPDFCNTRALQPESYLPLLREGLSQGGHTQLPRVDIHVSENVSAESLGKHLKDDPRAKTNINIFLDCGDETCVPPTVREVIQNHQKQNPLSQQHLSATVAIGPERGWTEGEAQMFQRAGFQAASLGPSILRVDTAVVAALSLTKAALQDCWSQGSPSDDLRNTNKKRRVEEL